MIKAAIFDMDGLLADTEPICYQVDCDIVGRYGKQFPMDEYLNEFSGRSLTKNMGALIEKFDLPLTVEETCALNLELDLKYIKEQLKGKPGAKEMLAYLKSRGLKIVLASSSAKTRADLVLNKLGLRDYFDDFVYGPEVAHSKPKPDIFLKACEKAFEAPEDCLVFEDSDNGVAAAYAAGCKVICVPDMKAPEESTVTKNIAICESLNDAVLVVEKLL